MQKITPFLWYNSNAEEAVELYTKAFKNSRVHTVTRNDKSGPGPEGTVMTIAFELDGQSFLALNGGPMFSFTEAVSFVVSCENQQEIDHFWNTLSEGGEKQRCGWLKDKFGLSWQIVPANFGELVSSGDAEKTQRVMQAMMGMDKMDMEVLERAFEGKE
jgi:predicted 3-demethylubiquinone-9 3-methyltransferase (glyoxalase superfamily)